MLGGCATHAPDTPYANAGYDDANYDPRLCWKKFVLRRASDNRTLPQQPYEIRDIHGAKVSAGISNEKGETLPVRCSPEGPLKLVPVYPR
ncbi:hypothetical protein D3C71_1970270 [compost metagenome]